MPATTQGYLRPGAVERIFGRVLASLVWIGLIRGHFFVLEVRGRKSGRTFTLPVDPIEFEGHRYLICARGNSNWVRNARAAGEVVLVRATRRRRYAVRELPPPCVRRSSRPISTDSQARCSASFRYRRDRRCKHSMIWRRVIRSSSCNQSTRAHAALNRLRDEDSAGFPECAFPAQRHKMPGRKARAEHRKDLQRSWRRLIAVLPF
jgi:hypothetical protein